MIAWALSPVGMGLIAKALRLLTVALALALAGPSWAQSTAPTTSVDETERGIVRVVVILESPQGRMLYGAGSGFVVAPNLVVTNAHVVAVARQHPEYQIGIVPPSGDGVATARIVSFSPMNELALLEYRGGPSLPPITISTVDPHTGDTVVALGYPDVDYLGASGADLLRPTAPSRTSGEIASLRDQAPTGDQIPTINHQAVISSGSSGGPLLDECGRVIGVNSWHVSGQDTGETRGVATRVAALLQFLDDAGVNPKTSDERCLSFAERVQADRAATVEALQVQNRELTAKLELADRLTRISVVILIGGTLALFVAVCVLGAVLLSRRHPRPEHAAPEPFEVRPPHRALGVAAVVGGATVAAILIVAAGVALLRTRGAQNFLQSGEPDFQGAISCTLDRNASQNAGDADDHMTFTATGNLCVNGRTLYARARDGRRYQRAIVSSENRSLDVLTIDPRTGEFTRDRYHLTDDAFASASQAADASSAEGCESTDARQAAQRRNESLIRFAEGRPAQKLVWRCEPRAGGN